MSQHRGTIPLIDEREFTPLDLEELQALVAALVEHGTGVALARTIGSWLVTKGEARAEDPTSKTQRSRYRKELAKLGEPPWGNRAMGRIAQLSCE